MVGRRLSVLVFALSGCDLVFGLDVPPDTPLTVEPDAASDAEVVIDAAPGAVPACWTSSAYQNVDVIPTSKYRVSSTAMTWTEARATCEADGAGAHLAVITEAEAELSLVAASALTSDQVWIGLDDRFTEGTWVAQTLEPVPSPPTSLWRTGEPNNSGTAGPEGEDCALLVDSGLNDGGCGMAFRALCECELPVTCNDAAGAVTVLPGPYTSVEAARAACTQATLKLVEISTPDEFEAVRKRVIGPYVWIDLVEPAPRDWRTFASGCRPYLRWAHVATFSPEPQGGVGEDCGGMSSEGMVDLPCTGLGIAAVCEEP